MATRTRRISRKFSGETEGIMSLAAPIKFFLLVSENAHFVKFRLIAVGSAYYLAMPSNNAHRFFVVLSDI